MRSLWLPRFTWEGKQQRRHGAAGAWRSFSQQLCRLQQVSTPLPQMLDTPLPPPPPRLVNYIRSLSAPWFLYTRLHERRFMHDQIPYNCSMKDFHLPHFILYSVLTYARGDRLQHHILQAIAPGVRNGWAV